MGGMLGRAAAGLGAGVSSMANRWIDEEAAQQRAAFLAELQRQTATNIREDDAAFRDKRLPVELDQGKQRALSAAEAQRAAELAGLNDQPLTAARGAAKDRESADDTRRSVARKEAEGPVDSRIAADREGMLGSVRFDNKKRELKELGPEEVRLAGQKAEAEARARAKFREQPASVQAKVADIEKVLGRELTEQEKLAALGLVKGNPEMDTEKVTEERMNPDGTTTKVERTQKRRAGGGEQAKGDADPVKAAMDKAREARATAAPAAKKAQASSPEMDYAKKVDAMDPETFRAFQAWKEGQPTSPRDRQLLRTAGIDL
jgi:hypothetical protein